MTDRDQQQDQDLLDQLAEEFACRCRRGEHPALQEYEQRFPMLADQLRQLLPSVALLEEFKRDRGRTSSNLDLLVGEKPDQLGDFRLIREIGQGGMGVVYEAVQESLGRRVALKVLPRQSLADPKRLERFRREAQAAARLHHTNVVPVFGLFEAQGWHFYVMQYIAGRGLDQVLAERRRSDSRQDTKPTGPITVGDIAFQLALPPSPPPLVVPPAKMAPAIDSLPSSDEFRCITTWIAQAAAALEYAHAQGVIHRDIKPANLLLDDRGSIWVTDFGLARLAEQDGLTNPGDVLGTLRYMAPESFQGESGARGDIYSLGLTFYELLTLRTPFTESHPGRLLREIGEGQLPRPRQIRREIPRDLETIALKAIARDPAQRYASAGEFAADLQRFLADQPIHARRTSKAERLWRWSRRNRALATLGAVALSSLVLAATMGWVSYVSTTQALRGEAARRIEAEAASAAAEENMQLSLNALDEIFTALAPPRRGPGGREPDEGPPPDPPQPPAFRPAGADRAGRPPSHGEKETQLLHTVLEFYERFAARNSTNTRLKREAARSYRRVGDIHVRESEFAAAAESYRHAIPLFAELAADRSASAGEQAELLDAQLRYIDLQRRVDPACNMRTLLDEARQMGQDLVTRFPDSSRYRLLLARIARSDGWQRQQQQDDSSAEKAYRQAAEHAKKSLDCTDDERVGVVEFSRCQADLARLLMAKQRRNEAVLAVQEAIDILETAPPGPGVHEAWLDQHDLLATWGVNQDGRPRPRPRPLPPPRR
jgi:serine/threonine protein kinase